MAKEKATEKKSHASWRNIIGGDILATEFFRRQTKLVVLIMVLILFYIHNRYVCQQQMIEIDKLKKEIDNDSRTTKDLFVDRYGATPLSEFFMIESDDIENKVHNDGLTLIELYTEDSIQCLLKSIPIKELSQNLPKDTLFYKAEATEETINKYNINKNDIPNIMKTGKGSVKIRGKYNIEDNNGK